MTDRPKNLFHYIADAILWILAFGIWVILIPAIIIIAGP